MTHKHPKNIEKWKKQNAHMKYCILYTDGSYKKKLKTIAVGISGINYKNENIELNQKTILQGNTDLMPKSTYAELWAIKIAIKHAVKKGYNAILIATDVQQLNNLLSKKHTVKSPSHTRYVNLITYIKQMADEHNITFLYTPSHAGIYYNELAHILANKISLSDSPLVHKLDIYPTFCKGIIVTTFIQFRKNNDIKKKTINRYNIKNKHINKDNFINIAITLILNELSTKNIKQVSIYVDPSCKISEKVKTILDAHPNIKLEYIRSIHYDPKTKETTGNTRKIN